MAANVNKSSEEVRRRLARIRCVKNVIDSFQSNEELPFDFCYVPNISDYTVLRKSRITLYPSYTHTNDTEKVEIECLKNCIISASGFSVCNSKGQWFHVLKISYPDGSAKDFRDSPKEHWLLLFSSQATNEEHIFQLLKEPTNVENDKKSTLERMIQPPSVQQINTWEYYIEHKYALRLKSNYIKVTPADTQEVNKLRAVPEGWSLDHDENLAQFLATFAECDNDNLGSIKKFVESIDVSSHTDDEGPDFLTDGDPETFWESDGHQGQHWIRLKMKKGTIIKKLLVTVCTNDDNYTPQRILVMGGPQDTALSKLNEVTIDTNSYGIKDILILEDQREHYAVIEIRIKECRDDGIDTRIHGIKMKSIRERDLGLNIDLFSKTSLSRFPKLENIDTLKLYRRAIMLQRFVLLLDSILPYLVPAWEHSVDAYSPLHAVRQLLPLSKKRVAMIETFLRKSETGRPSGMPRLYINRRLAAEHKADPSLDPDCKNTVFTQIYEGLKPRDQTEKPLDYRWSFRYDQWWECKFVAEGIIDQGGGFRDSLSDLADELCPSQPDVPVPLPFFIRAPNQKSSDSNVNRDMFVPNPDCDLSQKYVWLGKLMGACLRGKESLVLSLPPLVWKKLVGEKVTWSRDFLSVDEAEVRMLEHISNMDEETFYSYFACDDKTWSCRLSSGREVVLKTDAGLHDVEVGKAPQSDATSTEAALPLRYEDRHEYSKYVQTVRLAEFDKQIEWLQKGLLDVVPQAVLDLLTWQELEKRICGDPEISIEALRRAMHYEDVEEDETRVQYMWEALANFSNEDRSRFLRFVTGRRRLPAPIYLCPDKGDCLDVLPESSTCSNTLYLPMYSSAKACEEKLRYAAYNCIAIDTDMSPWEE